MRLLLDTCTFLWVVTGDERLCVRARELVADPYNDVLLSAISSWEIGVKHLIGKLPLQAPPGDLIPRWIERLGIEVLPFSQAAALLVTALPPHHKDPFDRMLICQAMAGGLTILTPDAEFRKYSAEVTW